MLFFPKIITIKIKIKTNKKNKYKQTNNVNKIK